MRIVRWIVLRKKLGGKNNNTICSPELLGVSEDDHSRETYERISREMMKAKERFFLDRQVVL